MTTIIEQISDKLNRKQGITPAEVRALVYVAKMYKAQADELKAQQAQAESDRLATEAAVTVGAK